jgi:hypothetical protein
MEPSWPIFEKCSHLREKGGGADAFENDPSFIFLKKISKGTVREYDSTHAQE